MMRRILASFAVLTMTVVLVARADDPAKTKTADKKADEPNILQEEVRLKQVALETRFQKLTVQLRTVAERMARSTKKEDREKAQQIQDALKLASEAGIGNKFRTLIEQLQKNKTPSIQDVDEALDQSNQVLKSLEEMLALLMSEGKDAERRAEIKRIENILKELNKVIRDQKIVRAKTERGAMEPKDLKDAQAKVTENTRNVAEAVGGKAGEKKDAKDSKGDAKGEKKENKDGKGKEGDKKENKDGQGKEGTGKESKDGQGKEGTGKPKDGQGKEGDKKENKDGQGKEGDKKENKDGQGKEGDKKENKDGQGKEGTGKPKDSKDGKGDPKDSKGDAKGNPSQGQPNQGQSKPNGDQKAQPTPPMPPQPQKPQPPPLPGRKQIEEAIGKQEQAQEKLPDKGASEEQDQAIQKLEEARAELEKLLKQKREEEMDALLAQLEARCKYMLQLQIEVYEGTKATDKTIKENPDKKPTRAEHHRAQQLSEKEGEIVKEAKRAIGLLEADNTAVAFTEVFRQLKEDMELVQNRLGKTDVAEFTQRTEEDIIQTLKDMIEALQKARQDLKNPPMPMPGQQGQPPPKELLDKLAELKLVRSRQIIVNKRTENYGKMYPGEQADVKDVQDELKKLGKDQGKLQKIITDMTTQKNQ